MKTSELVFIPSPGAGLLPPMVEFAKLLLHRDQQLSITIILMNLPLEAEPNTESSMTTPRLRLMDIPRDKSTNDHILPKTIVSTFIEHQKPHVRNIVRGIITETSSVQLVGFVVGMFSVAMMEVANEFGAPTYLYYTASASSLGLMFDLQAKHDNEDFDVTNKLKDSEFKLSIPSYANPVPAKVLPSALFDQDGGSNMFDDLARKYRAVNGIIVNTFQELERHAVESLLKRNANIPPIFPVGPILNMKNTANDEKENDIMTWLNDQPKSSVVFLCFGSMGSFNEEQVKEIGIALELSGQRFLWSLRHPSPKENMGPLMEYENLEQVLPEGFLERTSRVGKVIGWAPQMAVLFHPSIGGFVSHCGWNSTLESIWCGVPMAAWPIYAEQQLNAFKLVVELEIAAEIKIDYRTNMTSGSSGKQMIVTAEEIESGIRRLMTDGEMRKKVNDLKDKSRFAVSKDGSSHVSIGRFIDYVIVNE